MTVPEPADSEPGGAPPIFQSVESDYLHTRGQGLLWPGELQASQPGPAGQQVQAAAARRRPPPTAGVPRRRPVSRRLLVA